MEEFGVDVLLLSVGPDLPYLTGYEAMPLERLTMLVLPREGDAHLVVPRLEAPRVEPRPDLFEIVSWEETDDPIAIVAHLIDPTARSASPSATTCGLASCSICNGRCRRSRSSEPRPLSGRCAWSRTPTRSPRCAGRATAVDGIASEMRTRPFAGRTELDVHRELVERMLAAGHERSNFAIVAAGAHAASPHHEPSAQRTIVDGDLVLCDFGGTMQGYCSDITRMFHVGEPPTEVRDVYAVLADAQEAGVRAATVGTPCEEVDAAARRIIAAAGFGEQFIHRVGHGIGTEAHEDPYMVAGNSTALEAGHAFSVEPGIYFAGRFGMRLEDIVVATTDGPLRLNNAPRDIAIVS